MRKLLVVVVVAALCAGLFPAGLALGQAAAGTPGGPPEVSPAAQHAVSPPLRGTPPLRQERGPREKPLRLLPPGGSANQPDPVVQSATGPSVSATGGLGFAGVGNGDYGFAPNAAPPDTNL